MSEGPRKYGLSDSQWFSLLVCGILGSGILTLPRLVAAEASRDGWLSIVVAGAGAWLLAGLVWLLCKKFPTKTLAEMSRTILGKPLGILVSLLYALYTFAFGGAVLRMFLELIKTWILIWTPTPVILLAFLLPVVYISRMGAATLGRLTEFIAMLTGLVFLLWLAPAGDFNLLNLRPVGAEGVLAILRGAEKATFSFLGVEVMLVFFPLISNRKKALKVTLMALTAITLLYVGNILLIFGARGVEYTMLQKWPLMTYLRVGRLPVVQRVDALVLFFWTAQIISELAIQYYAGTITLASFTGNRYHDIWALVCWPLIYLVVSIPLRLSQVFDYTEILGRWGVVGIIAVVVLLLLVAKLRGLDESAELEKES